MSEYTVKIGCDCRSISSRYHKILLLLMVFFIGDCHASSVFSEVHMMSLEEDIYYGYDVYVDEIYIGTEGADGDLLDGTYIVNVTGNNQHSIFADDGKFRYGLADFFFVEGVPYIFSVGDPSMILGPSNTSNQPPSIICLAPSVSSPQEAGASITWMAQAIDPENDPIYYQFWHRDFRKLMSGSGFVVLPREEWQMVQDWSQSDSWTWRTDEGNVGFSDVQVRIRDGFHANEFDDFKEHNDYEITVGATDYINFIMEAEDEYLLIDSGKDDKKSTSSNQPPSMIGLSPTVSGPQEVGASVTWMAQATDPDNDPIYYQFWLSGPRTGDKWQMIQDWSQSSTWTWLTGQNDIGTSDVQVRIRDGLHASSSDMDDFNEVYDYEIKSKQLANLNVEVTNAVYSESDRKVYYCQEGKYFYVKNRVYLTGSDLDKVKKVTYYLHDTFPNPVQVSTDRSNDFEIWIWTWGRFPIMAEIETDSGQTFEKSYEFSFKSKYEEAQRRGIPMVSDC